MPGVIVGSRRLVRHLLATRSTGGKVMRQSSDELRGDTTRAQAAIVRTLSEELERLDPTTAAAAGLRMQLAEESGRLAFRIDPGLAAHGGADPVVGRRERAHILVVDDDDGARTALATWLSEDYDVTTACDGTEGIELARARPPDAVIADVWMPHLDGISMVRQMKGMDSLRSVPVLFLTGQTSPDSVRAGLSAGATAYLEKPVDLDVLGRELLAALRAARGLRRTRR
jgi:CheY-like chemotaxis protein